MARRVHKTHIVLDTNAIFAGKGQESSGTTDNFLPSKVIAVINDPKHKKLNLSWAIPRMVRNEREHHMREAAKSAVSHASKMPRLFNKALWDISQVHKRISDLAEEDLNSHGVSVVECDMSRVNWDALTYAAGFRQLPFSPDNSKEKGFKDAVVAETFFQFCSDVIDKTTDTAIVVTNDELLREHILARTQGKRVKVVENIDALSNELNVLASDIPPSLAQQLPSVAVSLLKDDATFWASVYQEIEAKHAASINSYPNANNVRVFKRTFQPPVFLRKEMTRVSFQCRLDIELVGSFWVPAPPSQEALAAFNLAGSYSGSGVYGSQPLGPEDLRSFNLGFPGTAPPVGSTWPTIPQPPRPGGPVGRWDDFLLPPVSFEVTWSADYVQTEDLAGNVTPRITNPHFDELELIHTP